MDDTIARDAWHGLQAVVSGVPALGLSRWLAGTGPPPLGVQPAWRDALLSRQAAYQQFVRVTLGRTALVPEYSLQGRLGYRVALSLSGWPFPVHVIGLDSAWLSGATAGELVLTSDQVMRLSSDASGRPLPGFRLALAHHPLHRLQDGEDAQRLLSERIDLLLHGCHGASQLLQWADPQNRLPQIAAGPLYDLAQADHYRNSCHLIEAHLDEQGRPLRFVVRFRGWSDKGHWFSDSSLYAGSRDGVLEWVPPTVTPRTAPVVPAAGARPPDPLFGPLFPGLLTIDAPFPQTSFRAYLDSARLPFYSREQHLTSTPPPPDAEILDEEDLLDAFATKEVRGMVITGGGGFGKTRLMLELAHRAQRRGWGVRRVKRFDFETLEKLASRLPAGTPALLLVDYVETQTDYAQFVESLNQIADEQGAQLRYVTSCRSSYYRTVELNDRERPHYLVELAPVRADEKTGLGRWLQSYRAEAVHHILAQVDLDGDERLLTACGATPVLAVFVVWLKEQQRGDDLAALLAMPEFGKWVRSRVQASLGGKDVDAELATLVALLPLPRPVTGLSERQAQLLTRLQQDGWIEPVSNDTDGDEQWEAAHDVLTDQVLLSYLDTVAAAPEIFVRQLLREAARLDNVTAALLALQRIVDRPPLNKLAWESLLGEALRVSPSAWREARYLLLSTSLLSPQSSVRFLITNAADFAGAESVSDFQGRLGWLAAGVVAGDLELSPELRAGLLAWIRRAAPLVIGSDYLLSKALVLDPQGLRTDALRWLLAHPTQLQTHFLLRQWLRSGLPPQEVALIVTIWLERFGTSSKLSFIAQSWLDAGGDRALVQEPIRRWLALHQERREAEFVYAAWLNAGGDRALVQEPIRRWLVLHQEQPEAEFVYKAWLDAGGERAPVQEPIRRWLVLHQEQPKTEFVYKAWLDDGGDLALVEEPIRRWLALHQEQPEAGFVYKAWLVAGGDLALVEEPIRRWLALHQEHLKAEFVYHAWLDAGGDLALVQESIKGWLAHHQEQPEAGFVYKAWLDAGGDLALVQEPIRRWLVLHQEQPEAKFVYKAWLEDGRDLALVQEPIRRWLALHQEHPDFQFVCTAWINAGGPFDWISDAALAWLHIYRDQESAVYLSKFIAKQRELPVQSVRDILIWCSTFPAKEDALWRLTALQHNLAREDVAEEVTFTVERVVNTLLRPGTVPIQLCPIVEHLWTSLLAFEFHETGELAFRIDRLFLRWLRHPQSFTTPPEEVPSCQRPILLRRIRGLLYLRLIDVVGDAVHLRRLILWINGWQAKNKVLVGAEIRALRLHFRTAEDIWKLFKG